MWPVPVVALSSKKNVVNDSSSKQRAIKESPPIRGRDRQIRQIVANLRAVGGSGRARVLIVRAGCGAGKTRLLRESATIAMEGGFQVVDELSGTCHQPGSRPRGGGSVITELAFVRDRRPGADDESGVEVRTSLDRLRAGLQQGLRRGPLLVVIDDAHLLDAPARRQVRQLMADAAPKPVLWMLAVDDAECPKPKLDPSLKPFVAAIETELVHPLAPLADEVLADVVADNLGAAPDGDLLALADCVGDRPSAVIELLDGLRESGELSIVEQVAGVARPPAGPTDPANLIMVSGGPRFPDPSPASLVSVVAARLQGLPEDTRTVVLLAAVLGSPFSPADLSTFLGDLPVALLRPLEQACESRFLVCREWDFAFRTPQVWRAVFDTISPPMRQLLHRQAAELMLARPGGQPAAALHLVQTAQCGDPKVVSVISDAAVQLLSSDPAAAGFLAVRGMDLVDVTHPLHVRFATTGVEAFVRARDFDQSMRIASGVLVEIGDADAVGVTDLDGLLPLRSWQSVALLLAGEATEAGRVASASPRSSEDVSNDAVTRLEQVQIIAEYLTDDDAAVRHSRRVLASGSSARPIRCGALIVHAFDRWCRGEVEEAVTTLRDAAELHGEGRDVALLDPQWWLALALARLGDWDAAEAAVDGAAARLPGQDAEVVRSALCAPVLLAKGELAEAARAATSATGSPHPRMVAPPAFRVAVLVALCRGSVETAQQHLRTFQGAFPRESSRPWWAMQVLLAAQVAAAGHDPHAALAALHEIWAIPRARRELLLADQGAAASCVRWAMAAGERRVAHLVVDTAQGLSAANPTISVLRVAAQHARSLYDGDAEAMAEVVDGSLGPWERAVALEDRAALWRDADDRDAAVRDFEAALCQFSDLGGERDAARVRSTLRDLGVRRRHWAHKKRPVTGWGSLTDSERKVAELAVTGLTNREVARHLFISPHTVGFHLRQVYRKLELRSRIDLIRVHGVAGEGGQPVRTAAETDVATRAGSRDRRDGPHPRSNAGRWDR
jgi:DNA-binding CsgD family transcriptional regulator